MTRERPVTDRELKQVLQHLGFSPRDKKGGSHEQWVRGDGKDFRRVTVDSHHAPYHRKLLAMMLRDAGIGKRDFFRLLDQL